MSDVPLHGVFEAELRSAERFDKPLQQVEVRVQLTSPTGRRRTIEAFWDGGNVWRFRFSPDEPGTWTWHSTCDQDEALAAQGTIESLAGGMARGPLRLSESRRHFAHADGTPFFFLADTAWNGAIKARPEDWRQYLELRARQGFTVIQFVCTHWRAYMDELAYEGERHVEPRPAFFQRMDAAVQAIADAGLRPAPVALWAHMKGDPGVELEEADIIRLTRYMIARWQAYDPIWMLAGDLRPGEGVGERWRNIGRAVLHDQPHVLATIHPCGQVTLNGEFDREPWYSFRTYQTGHGNSDEHRRWAVLGDPAREWRHEPTLPSINLEPNYENHRAYGQHEHWHRDDDVRRASYWSLLVMPTAGVTYGNNGIWPWMDDAGPAPGHGDLPAQSWREGLEPPGVGSMTVLRRLFDSLPWTELTPARELVNQPDDVDPRAFIAAAATPDRRTVVAYLPVGGEAPFQPELLPAPMRATWVDPRDGTRQVAGTVRDGGDAMRAPDDRDWVLLLEAEA
ncbi:MAG: DUF4038 domain-containing protein [Phycisphaeraceae bacterium]